MTEIPILFLIFIFLWVAIIACCRIFSNEDFLSMSESARRRRQIALNQQHRNVIRNVQQLPTSENQNQPNITVRPVRVTTISRNGGPVAMDFYEIRLPPRQSQRNNTLHNNNNNININNNQPSIVVEAPPPPFSTAYLVSSPVLYHEEPPPTYDECTVKKDKTLEPIKEIPNTVHKDIENYI